MNIKAWFGRGAGGATRAALLLAVSLAAATLAPGAAHGQEPGVETQRLRADIARLKRDVQRAELDIRRTDSLSRDEQAAATRSRERLARDRARREKENEALAARVRDAKNRIAAENARGDGYVNATGEIAAREKAVLALLAMVADTLVLRVEAGIPWDTDTRRERIVSLRRDIEAEAAAPEEAFARLSALFGEETKGGDEVTLSSRPLTRNNGEVINAQVLKIGNQAILYIDEEGKKSGMLERVGEGADSAAWAWREDLSLGERSAVKRAVAVKAGRETPQLAALEIPLAGLETKRARSESAAAKAAKSEASGSASSGPSALKKGAN